MEPVNKEFKIKIPQLSCQNRKIFILFRNYPFQILSLSGHEDFFILLRNYLFQILSLSRLEDFLSFSGIIFFRYCLCQDLKFFLSFSGIIFFRYCLFRPCQMRLPAIDPYRPFFFHLRSFWSLTLLS